MSYIKVNHSELESTAKQVDSCVSNLKSKMSSANGKVSALASGWAGSDFTQFLSQWKTVDNSDSTYYKLIKALESYSDYLSYAASKYKDAQTDAVNRANSLPKY